MRILLCLLPLLATGATQPVYRYQLDGTRSVIDAKVSVMGLAQKSAQFPRMNGAIVLSPSRLEAVDLSVNVDARALSAKEKSVEKQLKGKDFLDVANHPQIGFSGQRMTMTGPATAIVDGTLTARGVTRPARLQVTFSKAPSSANGRDPVEISARTTIDRRQYGMTGYGMVVGKSVTITIKARMVPN